MSVGKKKKICKKKFYLKIYIFIDTDKKTIQKKYDNCFGHKKKEKKTNIKRKLKKKIKRRHTNCDVLKKEKKDKIVVQ